MTKTQLKKLTSSTGIGIILGSLMGYGGYEFLHPQWQASHFEQARLQVCFTPGQDCTTLVVEAIKKAQRLVQVQAYSFTSLPIADALIAAKARGVRVEVLMDKGQLKEPYSQLRHLKEAGIPVAFDTVSGLAHNKVMILDNRYVLTGSFNWTKAAQTRNAENILFIDDPEMAALYAKNWDERFQHSH
jgi:phospholipase D